MADETVVSPTVLVYHQADHGACGMTRNGQGLMIGVLTAALTWAAPDHSAAQDEPNSMLILPRAAQRDDFDSVVGILQRGDFIDTEGEDRRTALSFAAANDNMKIVDFLLDHQAMVDRRDRFGDTALHWAAINGHADMVKRLLAAGAAIDTQNGEGITPLMFAITNNRAPAVRALIEAGADIHIQDYTGHDALSWARDKPIILSIVQRAAR